MSTHMTLAFVTISSALLSGHADDFLAATPQVNTAHIRQQLWAELGSRADPARLAQLELELQPMYSALPKGEHGTIETAVVRYSASRYFVQKHGWYLKGLEPSVSMSGTSSAVSIKADMVPTYVQNFFEEYLGNRGFSLHDLAIFLATLEDLVHEDRLGELLKSYQLHDFPTEDRISADDIDAALRTYMSSYILGMDLSAVTVEQLNSYDMDELYPGWADTVMWVQDVRRTVDFSDQDRMNPFESVRDHSRQFDLPHAERVVSEINDRYGFFQNLECRSLKDALVELEYRDTGRVPLSDFYRKGLGGEWQFTESVAYLRELGALDETDPKKPSVIISNYIAGPSNCLISTGFYTVCCMDECNALLYQLEGKLATPLAEPSQILEAVSEISSDTVHAPRNISEELRRRLDDIAEHHEGLVPLKGRLFAQWMHHAFPRECSFPHAFGTTTPLTQEAYAEAYGSESLIVSGDEIRAHISAEGHSEHDLADASLPWTMVEELIAPHRHGRSDLRTSTVSLPLKGLMLLAPLSVAIHLLRGLMSSSLSTPQFEAKKVYV